MATASRPRFSLTLAHTLPPANIKNIGGSHCRQSDRSANIAFPRFQRASAVGQIATSDQRTPMYQERGSKLPERWSAAEHASKG
jgi:hypothetical protein